MIDADTVFTYHKVFVLIIVAGITFTIATVARGFIVELIKKKMNPQKEPAPGSEERCSPCPSWNFYKNYGTKIIERLERGDDTFAELERKIDNLDIRIGGLSDNFNTRIGGLSSEVRTLSDMTKQIMQAEVSELRQALRDKTTEIEKLKHGT